MSLSVTIAVGSSPATSPRVGVPHSTSANRAFTLLKDKSNTDFILLDSPRIGSAAQGVLQLSPSNVSLPGTPASLKKQFLNPIDNCFVLLDQLRGSTSPEERNCIFKTLIHLNNVILKRIAEKLDESKIEYLSSKESAASSGSSDAPLTGNLLSHEFRAPLQEITSDIDVYQLDPSSEKLNQLIGSLESNYQYLQHLAQNLPEQNQKLQLVFEPFTFEKLQKNLQKLTQAYAEKNKVIVLYQFPDLRKDNGSPAEFNGPVMMITQVALNFINNGIKYKRQQQQPCTVDVTAELVPGFAPPYVIPKFSIKDNGQGVAEEKLRTLFEPFTKSGSTTSDASSGVGGYLSRQFINLMNPDINEHPREIFGVQSKLGEGSTFSFTSRIKRIPDSLPPMPKSPDLTTSTKFTKPNVSILWVEDVESVRKAMNKILKFGGCIDDNRFVLENGNIAVELCSNRKFDVVFLDENLGSDSINGCEAAQKIVQGAREDGGSPPRIVIVSGEPESEIRSKLTNLGLGEEILIMGRPVNYGMIIDTVNFLT